MRAAANAFDAGQKFAKSALPLAPSFALKFWGGDNLQIHGTWRLLRKSCLARRIGE
jgi:hypothetical protein